MSIDLLKHRFAPAVSCWQPPDGALAAARPGQPRRIGLIALGGGLVAAGVIRRSTVGAALMALGSGLVYQGVVREGDTSQEADSQPLHVRRSITVGGPPQEVYRAWQTPETFVQSMAQLAEVRPRGDQFHWRMAGPMGQSIEWDTRIVEDRPGERVAWSSVNGAPLSMSGEVSLRPAPNDLGTEVTLSLRVDPPGGVLGSAAAELFGSTPGKLLATKALHRFKSLVETGEVPTLTRQPAARHNGRDR